MSILRIFIRTISWQFSSRTTEGLPVPRGLNIWILGISITDRIKKGGLHVEYYPTDNMVADFFTKPLQGKKFLQFRKLIMNLQDWNIPWPKECVGNQLLSYYINCPVFGFQSHLLPVFLWIHEWIIWCSILIILTSIFDIPSLFDISSLFDIFLRLSSIHWFVCLQRLDNYSQLLYNLFHLYSVY